MTTRITCFTFIIILFNSYAKSALREKRLVLHSSEDVYNEIQNLKLEIQNLKLENVNMKASLHTSIKGKCRFYHDC